MSEVNQVNMSRWIVALRSGKYAQDTESLRTDDGYCCLGVACAVSRLGRWVGNAYRVGDEEDAEAMPQPVARWVGTEENPHLLPNLRCIAANDYRGWSFNQIADALESRYLPGQKAEEILKLSQE